MLEVYAGMNSAALLNKKQMSAVKKKIRANYDGDDKFIDLPEELNWQVLSGKFKKAVYHSHDDKGVYFKSNNPDKPRFHPYDMFKPGIKRYCESLGNSDNTGESE